jgi:hypothetical protein
MTDFRDRVNADRGLIKNIQLAIPGYRGYRKKEDLRIADRLLREELANRFSGIITAIEGARKSIIKKNELDLMEDVGDLVTRANTCRERLLHAEQGYTGISPDYRIQEPQLNQMYEWDLSLLDLINNLQNTANLLRERTNSGTADEMANELQKALAAIEDYEGIFDRRREFLAGLVLGGV